MQICACNYAVIGSGNVYRQFGAHELNQYPENFNKNATMFVQENQFENVVCKMTTI